MTETERLPSEASVFFQHLLGLWPGRVVPVFTVHGAEPGNMVEWNENELMLVVQEGREQLDRQRRDLENIRTRAQFLFTATLGLMALILAGVGTIAEAENVLPFIVWSIGILSSVTGLLGAAAVVVVRKELEIVDSTRLSRQRQPVLPKLAKAYASAVRQGENTVATHITVYRDAVLLVLVGAGCYGAAWLLAVCDRLS